MRNNTIDLLAHERHFFDHLMPMFMALDPKYRGHVITRDALVGHVSSLLNGADVQVRSYASRSHVGSLLKGSKNLVLCGASGDLAAAFKVGRRAVFTQHGAGQSFTKKSPSYAGYPHHKNVEMFLHPGPSPAGKDAAIYGDDHVRVIGCPKMDPWHTGDLQHEPAENGLPSIVFSSHWDCRVVGETRSAFWHMLPGLQALAKLNGKEWNVYGHGHPRALHQFRGEYEKRGVQVIKKFQDVLRVGDLYIMDHMSTLYEFASAGPAGYGRPVVVMNCPYFRKGVNHGLRFWDAAHVGINIWKPQDMVDTVRRALQDPSDVAEARQEALGMVYSYMDGMAAQRAAEAITEAIQRHGKGARITSKTRLTRKRIMKKSLFDRNQVALRAKCRLRNFKRGWTPSRSGGMDQGINAMRGRLFFTDETHADELVRNQQAEYVPGKKWPGHEPVPEPLEQLTEKDAPEVELRSVGGGYYEVVEDGHVQGKYRGKKAAEAVAAKLSEKWAEENLEPVGAAETHEDE